MNLFPKFWACRNGNISVMMGMTFVAIAGAAGAGLDYTNATVQRSDLQAALDSALLSNAGNAYFNDAERNAALSNHIAANVKCAATVTSTFLNAVLDAEVTCDVPTTILNVVGISEISIKADGAVAVGEEGGTARCVIALDPTMIRSVELSGGTNWNANQCGVHVNSTSEHAVNLSGGSTLDSAENCFVGGVKDGLSEISPAPEDTCDPVADVFASIEQPTYGACDHYDFNEDTDMTIYPGVYCGGMRISNATFTLEPGLYVIKDGIFESTGGATINGNGVSFYLTGIDAELKWGGGGVYNLVAMDDGPLAGFVAYLDPAAEQADKSSITGGGDTYYEGAFYFGDQELVVSGGGTVTTPSPFTAYVANNFIFSGGSSLEIGIDVGATSVPIPDGLLRPGISVRLIR